MSDLGILAQDFETLLSKLKTLAEEGAEKVESVVVTGGEDILSALGSAVSQLPQLALDAAKSAVEAALPTLATGNLAATAATAGTAALATVTSQGIQLADQDILALQTKIANDLLAATASQAGTATVTEPVPAAAS